ncbi:MAG: hypothetical protein LBU36_00930 [Clostridiales bacterium]|jgi:hypothetical protein|nr:hypothetical protein [Clostridiales bacterium]
MADSDDANVKNYVTDMQHRLCDRISIYVNDLVDATPTANREALEDTLNTLIFTLEKLGEVKTNLLRPAACGPPEAKEGACDCLNLFKQSQTPSKPAACGKNKLKPN